MSNAGEVVQDIIAATVALTSPGAGQTQQWSQVATNVKRGSSTKNGPTTQMSWMLCSSVPAAIAAVAILPN